MRIHFVDNIVGQTYAARASAGRVMVDVIQQDGGGWEVLGNVPYLQR